MARKTRALLSLAGAGLALGMLSGACAASISSGGTAGNGVTWVSAGGTSTYTVAYQVDSSNPLAAETWQLQVPLPAQTSDATWECVAATGAASCPATSSGSGPIDSTSPTAAVTAPSKKAEVISIRRMALVRPDRIQARRNRNHSPKQVRQITAE